MIDRPAYRQLGKTETERHRDREMQAGDPQRHRIDKQAKGKRHTSRFTYGKCV